MLSTLLSLGICLLAPAAALGAAQKDSVELRAAWAELDAAQKAQLCESLNFECRKLPTSQARTIYWVLDHEPVDPGFWGPPGEPLLYSADEHAPAYVVHRKALDQDDPRLVEQKALLLPAAGSRQIKPAFVYDWASARIVRVAEPGDVERIFENALNGYYPGQDLALAIAHKDLDDSSEQNGMAAFAHTYAWNEGEVFEGLTWYDAFASGRDTDLPDVDALGLLHHTRGDWNTWISPIQDQAGIYAVLSAEFEALKSYRELREALADTLFQAQPLSDNAFLLRRTQLHALWIKAGFEPEKLRAMLPTRETYAEFMAALSKLSSSEAEHFRQAQSRETQLAKDQAYLARVLKRCMQRIAAKEQ